MKFIEIRWNAKGGEQFGSTVGSVAGQNVHGTFVFSDLNREGIREVFFEKRD